MAIRYYFVLTFSRERQERFPSSLGRSPWNCHMVEIQLRFIIWIPKFGTLPRTYGAGRP